MNKGVFLLYLDDLFLFFSFSFTSHVLVEFVKIVFSITHVFSDLHMYSICSIP